MTGWLVWFLVAADIIASACVLWAASLIIRALATLRLLDAKITSGAATTDRIEAAAVVVAADLAASHDRADAADGPHGAASDAAMRTGDA